MLFRKWLKSTCPQKQILWKWSDHMCWSFQKANICRSEQGTYSIFHSIQQCTKKHLLLPFLVKVQNSDVSKRKKKSQCLTNFSKGKQFSSTNWCFQTNKREQDKNLPALSFPSLRLFHFLTGSVVSFQNNLLVTKIMNLGPYIYCTY